MGKRITGVVGAALLFLVCATATGAQGSRDVVAGAGTVMADDATIHFTAGASSEPDGSNPRGEVTLHAAIFGTTNTQFRGDVSNGCLIVNGRTALAVGELPESERFVVPGAPPGAGPVRFVAVTVVDNGPPEMGQPADLASGLLLFERTGRRACAGTVIPAAGPLTHGNFVVIDALP